MSLPRADLTRAEAIRSALRALLERTNRHAFVIFSEARTGKFVQFAGSAQEPLLLDLPEQTLDAEEARRAAELFSELGVTERENDLLDRPGGVPVGRQRGYNLDLGRDVERAACLVLAIFSRVYELPADFELEIEEN